MARDRWRLWRELNAPFPTARAVFCASGALARSVATSTELAPELVEERPQIGDVFLKHLSPFLEVPARLRFVFASLFVRRIHSPPDGAPMGHLSLRSMKRLTYCKAAFEGQTDSGQAVAKCRKATMEVG
jgi:hypothetical protein